MDMFGELVMQKYRAGQVLAQTIYYKGLCIEQVDWGCRTLYIVDGHKDTVGYSLHNCMAYIDNMAS